MATPEPPHPPSPAGSAERSEPVRRMRRLQAALDAASRDRAQLERELSFTRAENRRLRDQVRRRAALRARVERRRMRAAQWSRNP